MEVLSGGQPPKGSGKPRIGSTRHDHGNAADVRFYKDGRQLDWANEQDLPIFQEIVRKGKQAGITGFGAGPGYMGQGTMHIGFGSPKVWGAGGRGANAPDWLRAAYGDAAMGQMVASASPSSPAGGARAASEIQQPSTVPGSFAPSGGSPSVSPFSIDPIAAELAANQKQITPADRLGAAFKDIGQQIDQMAMPRGGGHPGGPSPQQANALLAFMNNPTVTDLLLKRRLPGALA